MRQLKKYLVPALILGFPHFLYAQIGINEIMYDLSGTDTGKEWVEIYNNGSDSVDISTYKFSEATTNHALKSINGTSILAPGEFGILADDSTKFLLDNPNYNGKF